MPLNLFLPVLALMGLPPPHSLYLKVASLAQEKGGQSYCASAEMARTKKVALTYHQHAKSCPLLLWFCPLKVL
jgi:hypothetical protein